MRLIDIAGQRFGRMLVLEKAAASPNGGSLWKCRCDCGVEKVVNSTNLRGGSIRSCGCLQSEVASEWAKSAAFCEARARAATRHGHKARSGMSPEYRTWLGMKQRCNNPANKDYKNWGGRGIEVCTRWSDFEAFLADMGPRPFPKAQIDRIDPNGNYEPGNCRWVSASVQSSENRRTLIPVEINGVAYPSIDAACRALGVSTSMAHERIRAGFDPLTAVTAPRWGLPRRRSRESYLRKSAR